MGFMKSDDSENPDYMTLDYLHDQIDKLVSVQFDDQLKKKDNPEDLTPMFS
jgi:hypothetical protein